MTIEEAMELAEREGYMSGSDWEPVGTALAAEVRRLQALVAEYEEAVGWNK